MGKMTVQPARTTIEVPAGRYAARFTGTEDREPFKDSKFGKVDTPRMGWLFEVTEGQYRGKKISQESGTQAVPRSTALRMLCGLVGRTINVGEDVDVDAYVGRVYSVKVGPNPDSDKGNLYIADLEPVAVQPSNGTPPQNAAPPAPAASPPQRTSAPPPRKPTAAPPERKFWFAHGDAEAELATQSVIQQFIRDKNLSLSAVEVCPEGGNEYRPAAEFGFKEADAF